MRKIKKNKEKAVEPGQSFNFLLKTQFLHGDNDSHTFFF